MGGNWGAEWKTWRGSSSLTQAFPPSLRPPAHPPLGTELSRSLLGLYVSWLFCRIWYFKSRLSWPFSCSDFHKHPLSVSFFSYIFISVPLLSHPYWAPSGLPLLSSFLLSIDDFTQPPDSNPNEHFHEDASFLLRSLSLSVASETDMPTSVSYRHSKLNLPISKHLALRKSVFLPGQCFSRLICMWVLWGALLSCTFCFSKSGVGAEIPRF